MSFGLNSSIEKGNSPDGIWEIPDLGFGQQDLITFQYAAQWRQTRSPGLSFRRRFLIPPIPRPSGKLPVYPFNAKRSTAPRTFKVLAPLSRSSDRGKRTPQQHDTHTPFRETSAFDHALDRTLPRVFDSRGRGKPHAYDLRFG